MVVHEGASEGGHGEAHGEDPAEEVLGGQGGLGGRGAGGEGARGDQDVREEAGLGAGGHQRTQDSHGEQGAPVVAGLREGEEDLLDLEAYSSQVEAGALSDLVLDPQGHLGQEEVLLEVLGQEEELGKADSHMSSPFLVAAFVVAVEDLVEVGQ